MKNGSYQHHIIWKKKVWPKLPPVVIPRLSMSPVATRCTTCCHSLSLVVPLVVTRFHSLSDVVPLVVTRCHSMYHSSVFKNDRIYRWFPSSDYLKTIWRAFSDDCCNRQWRLNVIPCFVDCVIISITCKISIFNNKE